MVAPGKPAGAGSPAYFAAQVYFAADGSCLSFVEIVNMTEQ